jgi:DNA gyrase subunit A
MEIGTVRQIDIDQEMQSAYMDYAMSVIVSRALPDVRDGLKPVHRRILFAMHDMGLRPGKSYKKSARIVGEVLGKYHPHGDAAVYEAMARMAQDFSLRYMLVDGQGNFGSIDGDSPAAMRYTEARLASIAEEMLADIGKDTVDFLPNFDETLAEPAALPALLPNLLLNGATGIAVGMTTNIPPHNLSEVCDAIVHLIDRYGELDEVTVRDLTRYIHGPDFPTGGVVYRYAGDDGDGERADVIRNAYALGRGRLTVQAQVFIEDMSRGRSRIVVTELPYQVNKTRLIERIADLVRDGKVEGIADLRDESDRQGMRICIELTRRVKPRDVVAHLFRLTPMQTTFGLRMLALVDGEPRLLPLKRVLVHYLDHRQEIVSRRSEYLMRQAERRGHLLEGLLRALDAIDLVVSIIRRSRTSESARNALMKELELTEIQAQAILDMPLKRLTSLERHRLADEYEERRREIAQLRELLGDPAKIRDVIRQEVVDLKSRHGDARRTRIVDQEKGHHTASDLVEDEDVVITLQRDGCVNRTAAAPMLSADAAPVAQMWGSTRDALALFSATGQAAQVPLHQVPDGQPVPVSSLTDIGRTEKIVGALILPRLMDESGESNQYVTMTTRGGRIKRIALSDFALSTGRNADSAMNVETGDQLSWVCLTSGKDDIVLVTRQGKAIRFSEADVRPMGLAAAGVMAVKLGRDDGVAGMGIAQPGAVVVLFTEQGLTKRTAIDSFPTQKRYGGGVMATKSTARTGCVAVAVVARVDQTLMLMTAGGQVTTVPVASIRELSRTALGHRLPAEGSEPYFDPAAQGEPVLLVALPGTGTDTRAARGQQSSGVAEALDTA